MTDLKFVGMKVVLVGTQGPLNLGSVARAMANFGLGDLRLVTPEVNPADEQARRMAVGAVGLLEKARHFDSLAEAVADCQLVIGTSRRTGKYRVEPLSPVSAAELALQHLPNGPVALVFGREDHGLSSQELDLCQRLMEIPTSPMAVPSMNLAQAVTVSLYQLFQVANGTGAAENPRELATGEQLQALYRHMRQTLLDIDYLDPQNPDHILRSFRSMFGRAALDPREVRILQGLWSRIDWLHREWRKARERKDKSCR